MATPTVNRLERALQRIATDLRRAGKPWALIGGLAVSARAEPRTTRDVDLTVAISDDQEAESLVFWLQSLGYVAIVVLEQVIAGRLSTVRFRPPGEPEGGVIVDLLFASSGIEPEITQAAEALEILPGFTVPVASIGHLLALKTLARDDRERPQDLDDIRALLLEAEPQDLDDARIALQLIEERGYHRGRRLREEFDKLTSLDVKNPSAPGLS